MTGKEHEGALWHLENICLHLGSDNTGGKKNVCSCMYVCVCVCVCEFSLN